MEPLIWSRQWAGATATLPLAVLLTIEVRTSRVADRKRDVADEVHDQSMSGLFDVAAASAIAIGLIASRRFQYATIRPRAVSFASALR